MSRRLGNMNLLQIGYIRKLHRPGCFTRGSIHDISVTQDITPLQPLETLLSIQSTARFFKGVLTSLSPVTLHQLLSHLQPKSKRSLRVLTTPSRLSAMGTAVNSSNRLTSGPATITGAW